MNPQRAVLAIPAEVMARRVGDETIILDLASGLYFGLDDIGTRVWQLIDGKTDVEGICRVLGNEYDVPDARIEADVRVLVEELQHRGLVKLG